MCFFQICGERRKCHKDTEKGQKHRQKNTVLQWQKLKD